MDTMQVAPPSPLPLSSSQNLARDFAIKAHGGQLYGSLPYVVHLDATASILFDYNADDHLIQAAYLHDVLEDTKVSLDSIVLTFGYRVSSIVWSVTDEPGANRRERKAKTYLKTRQDRKAVILKLADRIANLKATRGDLPGIPGDTKLFKMYWREEAEFAAALCGYYSNTQPLRAMWQHFNRLLHDDKAIQLQSTPI